jgi:rhamnulokinase
MAETGRFLTFDLGAESGRAVLGTILVNKMDLAIVHRFPNEPQRILDHFHWDTVRLFAEIKAGITRCVREHGPHLDGMGVDTWGVDYALLDNADELLGQPYHYRDHRTDGIMERTFETVPRAEVYQTTGIQFMQLNSLFQLVAQRLSNPRLLDVARTLLFTPDLLHFWLTGEKANEFTIATTSQCYDPKAGNWAQPMLQRLGIPTGVFQRIIQPGTVLGSLHTSVRGDTGAGAIPVIPPATHDTGSAVAAVPVQGDSGWAYISCGTWSLVGVELPEPVITDKTLEYNLTNEGGVNGTTRLLRNVMGLWILQQCRRSWERQGKSFTYEELARAAEGAPPFAALFDPDAAAFLNPDDMPEAIAIVCRESGQACPEGVAATVRAIIESLALKYRWVIERLEEVTGARIETIHMIGGGIQNTALCQATADACGRTVVAGPVEATAAGNVLVQAMAAGCVENLAAGRAVIAASFPLVEYMPRASDEWERAYTRFGGLLRA